MDKLQSQDQAPLLINLLWQREELCLGCDIVTALGNSPAWIWRNWWKLQKVIKNRIDLLLFHICMLTADCCVQTPSASKTWGPYHELIPITEPDGQLSSSAILLVFWQLLVGQVPDNISAMCSGSHWKQQCPVETKHSQIWPLHLDAKLVIRLPRKYKPSWQELCF